MQKGTSKGLGMSVSHDYLIKKPENTNDESFIDNDE